MDKFKIGVFLLFISSAINLLIIINIGFVIGPQLNEAFKTAEKTYEIELKNYELNKKNNETLERFNGLLNKSRKTMEK